MAGLMSRGSRLASRLLLYPSNHWIDPAGAEHRELAFGVGVLSVLVARSPGCCLRESEVMHLEFSGNGSRAERFTSAVAEWWGDYAVEVWGLNYPGYGQSTGPATLVGLAESGLAAYDALAAQAQGRPIMLGCHSIGCTVGLYVATQRPVAGMVLLNPPPLRQLIIGHYGWWNLWLGAAVVLPHLPTELDSLENASRVHVPAIFLSSQSDGIVPARFHRRVFGRYAGPKVLIPLPDAGHNTFADPTDPPVQSAVRWLWQKIHSEQISEVTEVKSTPAQTTSNARS